LKQGSLQERCSTHGSEQLRAGQAQESPDLSKAGRLHWTALELSTYMPASGHLWLRFATQFSFTWAISDNVCDERELVFSCQQRIAIQLGFV
jgi:hypothetical protein